ncbi:autolysin sensor kinase [Klebsiella pneumoniae]|uniref:Autolysin sensor kinase n=1 Tax=Klebsiella pneumoniae TaxID=573 RepID=A0A377TVV6_KLEPN|nr:autolysin sensor kinase [Klebsiella pneumoniae]
MIRRDSDQAGQLVQYLSTFFRKNLKRPTEIVTLADEIEHVNAYLQIEKARFQANLQIQMAVPEGLAHHQLPALPCSRSWRTPLSMVHRNILASAKLPSAPARTIAGCSWISKITPGCTGPTPRPAGWG